MAATTKRFVAKNGLDNNANSITNLGASGASLTLSGANALTLTTTGSTNITLPTSGTLSTTGSKLSAFAATTSAELAGVISDETGSGALVFATSPTLTTPTLGVATATSINGTTIPSSKTLTVTTDNLSVFAATTSAQLAGVISDETGSGALVFANTPTLVTPVLGTPTSGTLTNCTGLPVSGITASTTTALGVGSIELGHATDTTLSRSASGVLAVEGIDVPTISSTSTLTNKSLSDSTTYFIDETDGTKKLQFQLSGITTATTRTLTAPDANGTIALTNNKLSAFAATTSSELAGVISDETGSGALVFANTPTLVTPTLGVASATSINKVAITAPATSATLTIADGKTLTASNTLTFTGTDASSVAFGTGGTVAYTANKLSAFAATTSAELAGVISDETGSGSLVFSASPTFTGTVNAAAISTSGNVTVGGDLTVNGTTTTINSTTLAVDDKNVILGDVATPTDVTADGGGFTLKGTTDKTFNWVNATDAWTSSEHIALAAGKNLVLAGSTSGTVTMAVPVAAGTTTITFPGATGTLATLAGSETFTNKTLTSPTMTTPTLGVASATSINKVAITAPATSATLTIADGKTLTASNTLTFTGTDASSVAFGAGGTVAYTANKLSAFAATTSSELAGVISDETGSGALVFATSPTLVTPILGTPTSGTLTNCTGLPVSGISASTTTALGVGSIELGHATDTTIARSSAGVITVEGVVVPTISSTSTLTNKSLSDSTTYFIDETDGTKKMQFQLSGITTATTRTLTVPNFDGTIATLAGTESLSNKTITVSSFSGTTGAFSGAVTMTANTASTTNSTGTLVITGGLGVSGAINAGGEITAYASSDERLKENVAVISNAMGKINAVRGVTFDWKDEIIESKGGEDGYFVRKKDVGVIAQEIEAVLPEIVATRDNGTKAVRYEKLVALLIEAVKELGSKVEQLEAKAAK